MHPRVESEMRIVIVAPGSSIHARRWAESLYHRGHRVAWFAVTSEAPISEVVPGATTLSGWGRGSQAIPFKLLTYLNLSKAVRSARPDLVHLHYLNAALPIRLAARSWPNLVVSVWGSDVTRIDQDSSKVIAAKRGILQRAAAITATSRFLRDATLSLVEESMDIEVIPFGVDTEQFSPRTSPNVDVPLLIGYAKRFAPTYGPDVLLRAMPRVLEEHPTVRLQMVGRGDRTPYRQLAEELGVAHAVEINPAVPHDQLVKTMRRFSIFCMPSRSESFGVSALEAAACGLPVVASRVGGVPEVVEEGGSGLLVESENEVQLAECAGSPGRRSLNENGNG